MPKLIKNIDRSTESKWLEFCLRSFRFLLDASVLFMYDKHHPSFGVSFAWSKDAHCDRYVSLVLNFWAFTLWFGIGPADMAKHSKPGRVLRYDHGVHYWNIGEVNDWYVHGYLKWEVEHCPTQYVTVIEKRNPQGGYSCIDYDGRMLFTDGFTSHAVRGWKRMTSAEVQSLCKEAEYSTMFTEIGEDRYDPFAYVRVQDFIKYLI